MSFLNPWMLAGMAAIGIPIALHFFYRARYRPVPWAAMKFLRLAIEQTSRRLRFQELILLLLRILVLFLLALALARPASTLFSGSSGRGEAVDAILVFDTSYSMAAREGPKARLDRAKEAALSVIDHLPANSTVQVITCSDRAAHVGPRSPSNLDQARQLVERLATSDQSTDLLPGLTEAVNAFERAAGGHKEVYVFSDMQKLGWERQASALRAKCEEVRDRASLYLVRCSDRPVRNVAIIGITPQTGIPHTGARTAFTVLLRNGSSEVVQKLTVTLEVDGKPLEKDAQAVESIGPGETRAVTLTGKIDQAGWRVLTAHVQADDLDADNRFDRVILVRDQVRVLVVDGSPNDREPEKAGSFFLGHALLPVPDPQKPSYPIQPRIVRPSEASPALLADKELCILADVAPDRGGLPPDFVQRLGEWVREGHGLFIGCGPNVNAAAYNRLLGPKEEGGVDLLPLPLGEPFHVPGDQPLSLAPDSIDRQSFLAKFRESPLSQIDKVEVLGGLLVKEDVPGGRALLRYTAGKPALLSRQIGDGEVLLWTTSLDASWNYFPLHPTYTPFIHAALTHLTQRSAAPFNKVAGEPIRWAPSDGGRQYYLVRPDGERVALGKPQGGTGSERFSLTATDTGRAGIYQIVAEAEAMGVRFALVPDLKESESLEPITDDQIDELLGFKPIHLTVGAEADQFVGTERSRREWTTWLLAALLIFAIGEMLWAWACGRAW
jgi:Aerotolerance regulator N-terminal/von Willebrand factor type A domain